MKNPNTSEVPAKAPQETKPEPKASPMSAADASHHLLRQSVMDAYYLLNYSIITGKPVPEEVSKAIIESRQTFTAETRPPITTDMEIRFSTAYQQLAELMSPVTVESLRDTEDIRPDPNRSFLNRFRLSRARQVMIILPVIAICLIFLILGCEIAHLLLTSGLKDFKAKEAAMLKTEEEYQGIQNQLTAFTQVQQQLVTSSSRVRKLSTGEVEEDQVASIAEQSEQLEAQRVQLEEKLTQLGDKMTQLYFEMNAIQKNLATLFGFIRIIPGPTPSRDPESLITQRFLFVNSVQSVIEVLNRLLPILYGALGATAFLLRTLIPHIRQRTFSRQLADSISVRICLGMLCGAAIQWFFKDENQLQIFERSISSSALAFLAGYSVDLLFSVMDGLIQWVKTLKASQKT